MGLTPAISAESAKQSGSAELKHHVHVFRDDDGGYLAWLAAHPDGDVLNILHNHNKTGARRHRADCRTIRGRNPRGGKWTWPYVKVCADSAAELDRWEVHRLGATVTRCGICRTDRAATRPHSIQKSNTAEKAITADGRFLIDGPTSGNPIVHVWADDYIRFGDSCAWRKFVREEMRSRCGQLKPSAGQVLHATFFGPKHPRTDVENLVLYNIGTFPSAGRNGIRFAHGAAVPPAPDGAGYRFCYRYALEAPTSSVAHWSQGRALASFGWTKVAGFKSDKPLAPVWLAVWRQPDAEPHLPAIAPDTTLGVRVWVRPPHGHQPVWGGLVKGIVDGVICAFHGHTDTNLLPEVVARLAESLPAEIEEIDGYLRSKSRAALGDVVRLVAPYRSGVKWDPADHLCVAGEVVPAEPQPGDDTWGIRGELFELSR